MPRCESPARTPCKCCLEGPPSGQAPPPAAAPSPPAALIPFCLWTRGQECPGNSGSPFPARPRGQVCPGSVLSRCVGPGTALALTSTLRPQHPVHGVSRFLPGSEWLCLSRTPGHLFHLLPAGVSLAEARSPHLPGGPAPHLRWLSSHAEQLYCSPPARCPLSLPGGLSVFCGPHPSVLRKDPINSFTVR